MRKTILIVDDDTAICEVLQLMLEDLVFLDLRVSGTNGRDICQHLKRQDATRHIPIILLSTHREIQRIAGDAGADDFLTKPFQMEEVLSLATHYLGRA